MMPPPAGNTGDICPQCGIMHPPLKSGEMCPMATTATSSGTEIDFNLLFKPLKDICISQIENKKIEDYDKLFRYIILNVATSIDKFENERIVNDEMIVKK